MHQTRDFVFHIKTSSAKLFFLPTYLATDWMTLEEVSLILVKNLSVPPLRISKNPPYDWSHSATVRPEIIKQNHNITI